MSKNKTAFTRAMSKRGKGDDILEITKFVINIKKNVAQDIRMGAMYTIEYGAKVSKENIINIMNERYKYVDSRAICKLGHYYGLSNHYPL